MAKLGDLILRVGADTSQLNKNLGEARRSIAKNTAELQRLGSTMTRTITLPLAALGAGAIKSASDLETLETSFISLTGGAEQAAAMMNQLNEFTAKTPFQIDAVAKSARQLIASGTGIDEVNEQLQFLGDIAATSGSSIDDIAAIFAKVNAKGKVELENLNQLAERGIPIFTALADATGLPADKLGAGAVSVEQFNKTLKGFAQEGGFAAGAMERLSETAAGKFSTAMDNLKLAGAELAEDLMPVVKDLIDGFTRMMQRVQTLSPTTKKFALIIAGVASAVGPLLVMIPNLISGIKAAQTAFALLNTTMAANPFGAVAAAIGLVVGAVIMLNNASSEGSSKVDDLKKSLSGLDLEQQAKSIEGARTAQEAYVAQLKEEKAELMKLAPYKRTANSQAGRDLKKLEAAFETANADLAAMQQLEEGVTLKLKQKADAASNAGNAVDDLGNSTEKTTEKLKDKSHTLGFLMNQLEEVPDTDIWKPVRESTDKANESLGYLFNKLEEVPSIDYDRETMTQMEKDFEDLNKNITDSINGAVNSAIIGFGMMLGEGIATGKGMKGVGAMLLGVFADLAIQLGTLAIGYGIAIEQIKVALASLAGPVAIAAGVALVALGAGLKGAIAKNAEQAGVPAFAEGGLVYGPTMGLIGEYPGAKTNPEVIAPLDKLRGMLGGQAVQVTGKISGRDILLTSERNAIDRNRVRGF